MTDTVDKVFSDAGDEILMRGAGAAPQQRFVYVKPAIQKLREGSPRPTLTTVLT